MFGYFNQGIDKNADLYLLIFSPKADLFMGLIQASIYVEESLGEVAKLL